MSELLDILLLENVGAVGHFLLIGKKAPVVHNINMCDRQTVSKINTETEY